LRPRSLAELLTAMRVHGSDARLLAGGSDLLVRLRKTSAFPSVLVDLKGVAELSADISERDGCVRIGARAVMTDLVEHKQLRERFPALIEAARVVGSVQIRNRATLAGNLCNASPAADTAPPLLAYGAKMNLVSQHRSRQIPLDTFFAGPGQTTLESGEIVESIDVPLPSEHTGSAFGRLTRRHGVDLAIVSVCCVVRESGEVRVAFGAVGPRPFVITTGDDAQLRDMVSGISPISDLRASEEYRRAMVPIIVRRTLNAAKMRLQDSRARRAASGSTQASGAGDPRG
jgi:carbon-monoxide dehydrogenase medium subunit